MDIDKKNTIEDIKEELSSVSTSKLLEALIYLNRAEEKRLSNNLIDSKAIIQS